MDENKFHNTPEEQGLPKEEQVDANGKVQSDANPSNSAENGSNGSSGGSSERAEEHRNGKRSGGRRGNKKKPPKNDKPGSEESTDASSKTGLNVKLVQKTEIDGSSSRENGLGLSASELRGLAASTREEAFGMAKIESAEPCGIPVSDTTFFKDSQHILVENMNNYNTPGASLGDTGHMVWIDAVEETIAIPTLPVDEKHPIIYPKSHKLDETGSSVIVDSDSVAPKGGEYLGRTVTISKGKISAVQLVDLTAAKGTNVLTTTNADYDTSVSATLRHREAKVFLDEVEKAESAKAKGLGKNYIVLAPETDQLGMLYMDIIRDTVAQCERALICSLQFLCSLSQDRYRYGKDQSRRFKHYLEMIKPIADMQKDAKKFKNTSSIINVPKLVEIVKTSYESFKNFSGAYVYPKTCIAMKSDLQDLLGWSTHCSDHRSVHARSVLGFTTNFSYSDCTTINGDAIPTGTGLGGNNKLKFLAMVGKNPMPLSVCHPFWDGINALMSEYNIAEMSDHAWSKDGKTLALTYDPEFPTFALLVVKAFPHILDRLDSMCRKFYELIEEHGLSILPTTFVKYPFDKLDAFLKAKGYHFDNFHDVNRGRTVRLDSLGNLRLRFPETAVLKDEDTNDSNSSYSYYSDIMSAYSIKASGSYLEYTGRHMFPSGKHDIDPETFMRLLDPIIFTDASGYCAGTASVLVNNYSSVAITADAYQVYMGKANLSQILKARRLCGLIRSIPTGVVISDPVAHEFKNGTLSNVCSDSELKESLNTTMSTVDFSKLNPNLDSGMQLSSWRMHFAYPVDDYKAMHIVIPNTCHSKEKLINCIKVASIRGSYSSDMGNAARLLKDDGSVALTPCMLVKFPFSWVDMHSEDIGCLSLDKWSFHSKTMEAYSNPFIGIRERSEAGEDAPVKLVPHQIATNQIYYWIDLDCEESLAVIREQLKQDKTKTEASTFKI